jgi:membrane protease subunit HflC
MKKAILTGFLIVLVAAAFVAGSALYSVRQSEQAIVLYFGEPVRVVKAPGLKVKYPFVEEVRYFDKRVLDLDPPEVQVQLIDKKRINVDAYTRYRIVDPLLFYQSVRNEANFQDQFGRIVNAALKRVIAKVALSDLLSEKRDDIMATIRTEVAQAVPQYGVQMLDIRIGRTDLPKEISQNVYNRMRTEREREAKELRAEGTEAAQKIRAKADRQRVVLIADAERQAEILRGEGEGERNTILGQAYGKDPEFFAFYKSMAEYKKSLGGSGTTMVLSPDSDFFRFFGKESAK